MQTTTEPKILNFKGVSKATTPQLAQVLSTKLEKAERFLKAEIDEHGFLLIYYRSKSFFVSAIYKQNGELITKHFYRNWNDTENKPFNPVNFKD